MFSNLFTNICFTYNILRYFLYNELSKNIRIAFLLESDILENSKLGVLILIKPYQ